MDMIKIGIRMRDTRKDKGLTLQDVADALGVAKSTIQRYEKGLFDNIKLPIVEAVAKCLDVNPSWLIYKSDIKDLRLIDVGLMQHETGLLQEEADLIARYKQLNDDGKNYLNEFIDMIITNEKYINM